MPRKLRVEYTSEDSFRREYAQNISKGGLFVPTSREVEIRESVEIELALSFADESILLPGEVVHCIPPEMAQTGAQPGVAIQFMVPGDELRAKLASFAPPAANLDERAQGTGRRVAPRSRARVPAQLRVGDETLQGHTRNVSSSGVLMTLSCDPPAIGKSVEVQISHPTVEEDLTVPGKVARHVESSGTMCVGVQFQLPEARQDEVAEFIERVRAVEHSRRLGGINGPIADLGIRNVLAMFGNTAPEGMLTLARGPDEGYITIEHGQVQAQLGNKLGREALDEMLAWTSGSFEFEALLDDGLVDGPRIPVSEVCEGASAPAVLQAPPAPDALEPDASLELADLEGLEDVDLGLDFEDDVQEEPAEESFQDEEAEEEEEEYDDEAIEIEIDDDDFFAEAAEEPAPQLAADTIQISPDDRLCVADAGADRSDLNKTQEAILDLAAVGMTVAKAIDIIPESEDDVYAAVQSLVHEGLLSLG